ncbi:MAG: hypothetical protein JW827_12935 [Spirochaetes bacterium]|nr:hypothetical protein [Spirochaetota bacterium]
MRITRWICLLFMPVFLTSCFSVKYRKPGEFSEEPLYVSMEDYPKVDGSTSAQPLQVIVACYFLKTDYEWISTGPRDVKRLVAVSKENPKTAAFIHDHIIHNGTHEAYVNLIERKVDLILVERAPSQDEIDLAKKKNTGFVIKPVALDAYSTKAYAVVRTRQCRKCKAYRLFQWMVSEEGQELVEKIGYVPVH